MEPASYGVFECSSFDIIEFGQQFRSIDGYRYVALYVDHSTNKLIVYEIKRKDELLSTLKLIIHQYGPTRNRNSLTLNYLNCDSGSEQLEATFLTYCRTNNIYINAVTSQHILYYCTYYSVSLTCTVHCVHCTIDIDTLYAQYMLPVSLFPMLRFHLQHLFTTHVHTYTSSHFIKYSRSSVHLVSFTSVNYAHLH
jgi:hypothetical protein